MTKALCDGSQIQTLLTNFVRPLQGWADAEDRVHGSLNLNTETGRLSSRNPNLQNQPALEKDRYQLRKAFTCEPNKALVVADYGQLELRLLAHLSGCMSMIEAFQTGGDFHSRTAISMYPAIEAAIQKGDVLLEWNEADGEAPAPLVKDVYSSERRKAWLALRTVTPFDCTLALAYASGQDAQLFDRLWQDGPWPWQRLGGQRLGSPGAPPRMPPLT